MSHGDRTLETGIGGRRMWGQGLKVRGRIFDCGPLCLSLSLSLSVSLSLPLPPTLSVSVTASLSNGVDT